MTGFKLRILAGRQLSEREIDALKEIEPGSWYPWKTHERFFKDRAGYCHVREVLGWVDTAIAHPGRRVIGEYVRTYDLQGRLISISKTKFGYNHLGEQRIISHVSKKYNPLGRWIERNSRAPAH